MWVLGFASNEDFAPTVPKNRKRLERLDDMVQSVVL
jgi:hypothetical protein